MNCIRCQGLMVEDHFVDLLGTAGLTWMKGWHCVNCGHVTDPLVEANRRWSDLMRRSSKELTSEHDDMVLGGEALTLYGT